MERTRERGAKLVQSHHTSDEELEVIHRRNKQIPRNRRKEAHNFRARRG